MLAWLAPVGEASAPVRARVSGAALLGGVSIPSATVGSLPTEADAAMAVARQLHAQIVRIEVSWSAMEPTGPGLIEPRVLAYADRAVQGTPCWASSAPASLLRRCVPSRSSEANEWPPSDPSTFAAFVAYLAARYGSNVAALAVWHGAGQDQQSS